jgi:endonuclease-3 related protein
MHKHFGPQHWWPGETQIETIVGAVLTQNTNWKNVTRAIVNLKSRNMLDAHAICRADRVVLAEVIRPSGYYNIKAKRLQAVLGWIVEQFDGDLERMFQIPLESLRPQLLSIHGVGPETADSILLYAGDLPTFVVDTYTYRVLRRHGLIDAGEGYDGMKELFESNLSADAALYNEFHALMVQVGKHFCRPRARCDGCPLERFEHDEDAEL